MADRHHSIFEQSYMLASWPTAEWIVDTRRLIGILIDIQTSALRSNNELITQPSIVAYRLIHG